MPKYRYQTTDAEGNPISGELVAAGLDDARQKLAAQGLDAQRAQLTEVPERVSPGFGTRRVPTTAGRLSAEEAAEVGSQLAQLAKAGLPLASGLRAMAEEMPQPRVARALRRLADQLDAGMSLEAALEALGKRFPAHVRGLILAGIQTGRLPEALEEFVAVENGRTELRRRVRVALAYPCTLVGMIVGLFFLLCPFVVTPFGTMFDQFEAELPLASRVLVWMAGPGFGVVVGVPALVLAAFVCLGLAQGAVWSQRVLYAIPLVGPMWRWAGLFNFSRLMALLLGHQVPLPGALRLTAAGLREPDLSAACREAAMEVEAGRPFSECLADFWQFPPSLKPLVVWGEQTSNPSAAFRAGAELFDSRVRVYVTLLQTIMPPNVFILIIGAVFFLIWGLLAPMVSLIQALA